MTAAATASSATGVKVYLDQIETYTGQAAPGGTDTEINDITWADSTNNSKLVVLDIIPSASTGVITGVAGKYSQVITGASEIKLVHTNPANSVVTTIIDTSATPLVNTTAAALNTNPALAVNEILTSSALAAASAVGVTMTAKVGGKSSQKIVLKATNSSATNETSNANAGAASDTTLAVDDVVGLTIAGLTGTATISAALTSSTADLATIAFDMAAAWTAAATATNTLYTVDANTTSGTILVEAVESAGSRADGGAISVVIETGASTTTIPVVGYVIGYDRQATDNKTESTSVIVTLMSDSTGVDANTSKAGAVTWTGTTNNVEMTNTTTYTTAPSTDKLKAHALADVIGAVNSDAGTVTAGTNVNLNYLGWVK